MDSIHKPVMVGFLGAFHTDVQNASKLSKSCVAHKYQSFLLYRQMVNLPLGWEKAMGDVLPQMCRTTGNWFIKSWSVLFAACSEHILRTWPNSHQIHSASVGAGTYCVSQKEHFSGMRKNSSWVGDKREWQKERNLSLIKFPPCYFVLKDIAHFVPWKLAMSDRFLVDGNATIVTHIDLQ